MRLQCASAGMFMVVRDSINLMANGSIGLLLFSGDGRKTRNWLLYTDDAKSMSLQGSAVLAASDPTILFPSFYILYLYIFTVAR